MAERPHDGSSPRFCFPKSRRLLRRREFVLVQRRGKRFSVGPMLACVRYVDDQPTRVGVTTSKRVGRAHVRTRIRRLLREAIRRIFLPAFPDGLEVVFIAKNDLAPTMPQATFDAAMTRLVDQLRARRKRRKQSDASKAPQEQGLPRSGDGAEDQAAQPQASRQSDDPKTPHQ